MAKLKINRNFKWYAYDDANNKFFASECEYYVEKECTDYFNNNKNNANIKFFDLYKVIFDKNDEIINKILILKIKYSDDDQKIIIEG